MGVLDPTLLSYTLSTQTTALQNLNIGCGILSAFVLMQAACVSSHMTPESYRSEFSKRVATEVISGDVKSVAERAFRIAKKCFESRQDNIQDGNVVSNIKMTTIYNVLLSWVDQKNGNLVIEYETTTSGGAMTIGKGGTLKSYVAIADFSAEGSGKTNMRVFFKRDIAKTSLIAWAKNETTACPELNTDLQRRW